MQDYAEQLLMAINRFDPDNLDSVNHLRDLVCWISDSEELKKDKFIAQLLYSASQKMRVFGYNKLNGYVQDPSEYTSEMNMIGNCAIENLYRAKSKTELVLDKSQKEIVELFQASTPHRLLVSAPTSYGKTFLMREIIYLNKERYNNIILVFPTVALLLENARTMAEFVSDNCLGYEIVKTVDDFEDNGSPKIFVFTPERTLQFIALFPDVKIDFFFFDEIYKIDEDYCNDDLDEKSPDESDGEKKNWYNRRAEAHFLNEGRGKTFRIALYLLAKRVDDYYLAGPNLQQDKFGQGLKNFIVRNNITVKEIIFEPTLRIAVNVYNGKIDEKVPDFVQFKENLQSKCDTHVNERIRDVIKYIDSRNYGKTLLYCTAPYKAIEYSNKLSNSIGGTGAYDKYPYDFKQFIDHIENEYDYNNSSKEWSLIRVLKNGFGMHHGKLPKYIQQEILDQFNKGTFNILFCTSTIVEGVNTYAKNMIILNSSKGGTPLTSFDIKNIKGRAGRYYHCFVGRVFYMSKSLREIEEQNPSLDFITYSNNKLSNIDLDNTEIDDLTADNKQRKLDRDKATAKFSLPYDVFIKNRTISKENQEKLLQTLLNEDEFYRFKALLTLPCEVNTFLKFNWINKILNTYLKAGLIDEVTCKRYKAICYNYSGGGFKKLLSYELSRVKTKKVKSIDKAYTNTFATIKETIEHKIPQMLSLFESIIICAANIFNFDVENFSLSKIRRYYETGVKSLMGEALIEYGFPTDAVRRIEREHKGIIGMSVLEGKNYCRKHFLSIKNVLDPYEVELFIRAMKSFK